MSSAALLRRSFLRSPAISFLQRSFSSSTSTKIGGSNQIPLHPEREAWLQQTLKDLSLDKENNPGVYPLIKGVSNKSAPVPRYDPTTSKPVASVQNANWEEINSLLDRSASVQLKWRELPGDKRVDIVLEMNEELKKKTEPLAKLLTFEVGKVPSESRGELIEIFDVAHCIEKRRKEVGGDKPYVTRVYESGDEKRRALGWKGEERQLPLGVIGKVTAFNFPYAVFGWGALPALCAGNSVFLKPHPEASVTSLAMIKIMSDVATKHGFEGLVGLTVVSDWELTHKMWRDTRVRMWEVTGSEKMGQAFITEAVATNFARSTLELGGHNAVIIHKDANVDTAIESTVFGSAGTAGQRCTSTRAIYVHESVYDRVVKGLVDGYQNKLRIGDPFQHGVNVGPVHHQRQVETYNRALQEYKAAGSKLLIGGRVISGNFVEPTIMEAPKLKYDALLEEYFAPVVHVLRYGEKDGISSVIEAINRSGYGLSGGIFTKDEATFRQCVERIEVGIFNHNYGTSGAEAGENFGGERRTGNGRMMGPHMFKHYTRFLNSMRSPYESEVVHAQGVSLSE